MEGDYMSLEMVYGLSQLYMFQMCVNTIVMNKTKVTEKHNYIYSLLATVHGSQGIWRF